MLRLQVSWTRWRLKTLQTAARLEAELVELQTQVERHRFPLQAVTAEQVEHRPNPVELMMAASPEPEPWFLEPAEPPQPEPLLHLTPGSPLEVPEELKDPPPAQEEIARLIGLPTPPS
jgi:hypothetical protein